MLSADLPSEASPGGYLCGCVWSPVHSRCRCSWWCRDLSREQQRLLSEWCYQPSWQARAAGELQAPCMCQATGAHANAQRDRAARPLSGFAYPKQMAAQASAYSISIFNMSFLLSPSRRSSPQCILRAWTPPRSQPPCTWRRSRGQGQGHQGWVAGRGVQDSMS
jgi:hypothetical protein